MAESCSASASTIHGGGSDLVFPHHENEAAQTAAARGAPLARLWMHNGMVRSRARRWRSRSATSSCCTRRSTRTAATRWSLLLPAATTASRSPSRTSAGARRRASVAADPRGGAPARRAPRRPSWRRCARLLRRAGRRLQHAARRSRPCSSWVREANRARGGAGDAATCARCSASSGSSTCSTPSEAGPTPRRRRCSREREAARAARDFAEADRLRDELAALGWEVRDARRRRRELVPPRAGDPLRPQRRPRGAARRRAPVGRSGRRAAPRGSRGCAGAGRPSTGEELERRCGSRRPPGRLRRGRAVPLRRRRRAAGPAASADRRARRDPGPAEPRRDLPHGRVAGATGS